MLYTPLQRIGVLYTKLQRIGGVYSLHHITVDRCALHPITEDRWVLHHITEAQDQAQFLLRGVNDTAESDSEVSLHHGIEEGWGQNRSKGFCVHLGGRTCFALVDLEEKDEFNLFFQTDQGKTASAARN